MSDILLLIFHVILQLFLLKKIKEAKYNDITEKYAYKILIAASLICAVIITTKLF